jgi:hypothetical protein
MPRASRPESRVNEALRLAREAHEMMVSAVVAVQAHGFLINAVIATLRDSAVLPAEAVQNIFVGAAVVLDAQPTPDEETAQTLEASRALLTNLAAGFRIVVPPKGQASLPWRQ